MVHGTPRTMAVVWITFGPFLVAVAAEPDDEMHLQIGDMIRLSPEIVLRQWHSGVPTLGDYEGNGDPKISAPEIRSTRAGNVTCICCSRLHCSCDCSPVFLFLPSGYLT